MTTDYDRWAALAERDSIGEALTAEERAFLREYAAADPLAGAEAALFDSLAAHAVGDADAEDRALADAAVRRALAGGARRPNAGAKKRWLVWGIASAAATAAAVAVFVHSPTPIVAPAGGSLVEYVAGEVTVAGERVEKGAHVAVGGTVAAIDGPACVAVEPRIHACLASGARVRLSAVGKGKRRLDLLAGRVAMALDPLPPGERLSVVANGVWSTAVGTAFTVELLGDGTVRTVVHEGKVAVGAEGATDIVDGHKIGLTSAAGVRVEPPIAHAGLETPDWVALAQVANRSIEGPTAELAAGTTPEPVAPAPEAEPTARVAPAPGLASHRRALAPVQAEPPAAEAPTPASLLAAARQALREQRWSDAASSYGQLVSTFPSTPEAHAVLVPLAKLELDRLGHPAVALRELDAYLERGGPLSLEAKLAKIRAYRLLGRPSDEASAIDDVLATHPSGFEVEELRARRRELRAP